MVAITFLGCRCTQFLDFAQDVEFFCLSSRDQRKSPLTLLIKSDLTEISFEGRFQMLKPSLDPWAQEVRCLRHSKTLGMVYTQPAT
jgi:hypothetical protein